MADTYRMANFASPMPPVTSRAHYEPSWRGDRPAGIFATARKRPGPGGVRCIDINLQVSRDGTAWAMHWGNAKQNNFKYIVNSAGRVRPMTKVELRRSIARWSDAEIRQWRRGKTVGTERAHTYAWLAKVAVQHHVVICGELKSTRFAERAVAARLVAEAKAAGHPPWFMALINMKDCRGKCAAIRNAGGSFAVIFGRFRFLARRAPKDWSAWHPKPTRLWGPAKWPL